MVSATQGKRMGVYGILSYRDFFWGESWLLSMFHQANTVERVENIWSLIMECYSKFFLLFVLSFHLSSFPSFPPQNCIGYILGTRLGTFFQSAERNEQNKSHSRIQLTFYGGRQTMKKFIHKDAFVYMCVCMCVCVHNCL